MATGSGRSGRIAVHVGAVGVLFGLALTLPWPRWVVQPDRAPPDGRTAVAVTAPERAAVRAVMQASLASVHGMLAATADDDLAAWQRAATGARQARERHRAALPAVTPALWNDLGHAAEQRLAAAAGATGGDRETRWADTASTLAICTDCHARFHLQAEE